MQEWLNLTPTTTLYKVPSRDDVRATSRSSSRGDQNFTAILGGQLPHPAKEWQQWWLLYCGGCLIGATSPWTIVYTPAEYTCPEIIPWQNAGGLLTDPLTYYDPRGTGDSYELALLLAWVELVLAQHTHDQWGIADQPMERTGAIRRELETWRRELQRYRLPLGMPALEPTVQVEDPLYAYFLMALYNGVGARRDSDILLGAPKGRPTLVLSRSGLSPRKRVYQATLVDQLRLHDLLGPRQEAPWRAPNGREIPYPYLIAEEAFLPRKLAQLRGDSEQRAVLFATPLTPIFFQYFN